MRRFLAWLWHTDDDDPIEWPLHRRQQAEEATERLLLGSTSPAIVVGNRVHDAVIADRERRAREMGRRDTVRRIDRKRA